MWVGRGACTHERTLKNGDILQSTVSILIINIGLKRCINMNMNNMNKFISEEKKKWFHNFYKYLNISWKPILWVLPLSHRLPKQQHCSEIINTKIYWSNKGK